MYWVGVSLISMGIGGAMAIEGADRFASVPAFAFVLLVGLGVVVFAHGTSGMIGLLRAVGGSIAEQHRVDALAAAGTARMAFLAAGGIGMLIGLVHLLSALDDPAELGAGVATAMLAMFYGSLLSFLICMPIERRLLNNSSQYRS